MARIEKTVFISYRRKDVSWALAVYQDLTYKGYDVFFDYTSIPSGDFEQIIISNIKARAHFVLILTPTTLDRCSEPGDWLRREIEKAIDEKRNIIPLFFDGFNFGTPTISEKLTGKLKNVNRYNGMNVHHDYFLEAMERLRTKFLNVPLDAVLQPVSTEVQEVVKEEKLAANQALLKNLKEKPVPQQKPIIEAPKTPLGVTARPSNKLTLSNGMEFMRVPAGKFIMGSNKDNSDEKPQHTIDIPYDYWMARYLVTNEQYNIHIKAKGIEHPVSNWENKRDHPVVNVNWNSVMEYCQWLNNLLKAELPSGLVLRLPNEAEWEKAARGTDGREYPWGNTLDKNKCNSSEGGKGGTTSVGSYSPQGDSLYGCSDMAGNVWEWTCSLYKPYPFDIKNMVAKASDNDRLTLRGGSWLYNEVSARCSVRIIYLPSSWFSHFGFRVAVSIPNG